MNKKKIIYDKNRDIARLGKFRVSDVLIEKAPDEIMQLMSNMIITRAEHRYWARQIEYEAFSPLFREIRQGELIPFYEIIANIDLGGEIVFTANESDEVKSYVSKNSMQALIDKTLPDKGKAEEEGTVRKSDGIKEVHFKNPEEK